MDLSSNNIHIDSSLRNSACTSRRFQTVGWQPRKQTIFRKKYEGRTSMTLHYLVFYYLLADIPGVTRVFIYPTPESCSNIHTQTHTLLPRYLFIQICYQTNAHKPIHIYIYNIYIRCLYIHIVICVPSLVEIVPGVPELHLSGVIYHRIPHCPETQKFRYFTVMWHRTWSARFTYLNTIGRTFVCMF
jgi:hypothetical protein